MILSIKCGDYIGVVDADSHVNIYALATVKETGQRFVACEAIWIEKPHIELKVLDHKVALRKKKQDLGNSAIAIKIHVCPVECTDS